MSTVCISGSFDRPLKQMTFMTIPFFHVTLFCNLGDYFTIFFLLQLYSCSFFGPCVLCALLQYFFHHFTHAPLHLIFFSQHNTISGDLWIQTITEGHAFTKAFSFPFASCGLHIVQIPMNSPKIVKYGILIQNLILEI